MWLAAALLSRADLEDETCSLAGPAGLRPPPASPLPPTHHMLPLYRPGKSQIFHILANFTLFIPLPSLHGKTFLILQSSVQEISLSEAFPGLLRELGVPFFVQAP